MAMLAMMAMKAMMAGQSEMLQHGQAMLVETPGQSYPPCLLLCYTPATSALYTECSALQYSKPISLNSIKSYPVFSVISALVQSG